MDFYEVLDQVIDLLKQRGRVTYRALQLQFKLDDESLETLKDELIYAQQVAVDEDDRVLVWTGGTQVTPVTVSQPAQISESFPEQQCQPAQAESPHAPPTPDAERRQLTVMFCDLADSTKLSGQLDPEDLRDVIRAYQATSAEVIERYEGYIAQHLGDGLMVYFGWPQAHEDDAQRAVYAGLGILEAMRGLNSRLEQKKGIRLAVRIGIHTGLVVVGEIGQGASQEHLALGETPNIASRIEGVAEPDTVAISATTYQLVQGYFLCDDLGQHTLKGVDEPQQVYRVVGASGAQSRLEITRRPTPLVGRESEVTLLLDRWQQVKDGQGQVVVLGGEAGIGKSRLLQVMKVHVAGEAHTLLECRSSPYYQNTALYPMTDLLQRALRWQKNDTLEEKLAKLEQTLRQYRLDLDEVIPLFATLLSLPLPEDRYPALNLSPQRQRQKTLETIVAVLLESAEQQPLLFILEDLHWTDPTTLEFLELLIDQLPTASILTLLTCRPTFQPSWHHRSYLSEVTLNRLTQSQIERMAGQVAGGMHLPEEVLQQIVEKTDGVPLFVEEMTKAIVESGHLKEVDGQYELTDSLLSMGIPTTLQDSLMARLDRLMTAKVIAQLGAVIGRQFPYDLLHAVSQLDEMTLQRELGRLVEAELIYQRGLPPQATYLFKHALVVDAAYQSLLNSTRQQYHQRIAQALEERFPEIPQSQPELLARHYTEAGLTEQAVDYWYKAGQNAVQRSAYVESSNHLKQGLEALKTRPETPERLQHELTIQVALGRSLMIARGYGNPEAGEAYDQARKLCQRMGDNRQLFSVLRGLVTFYYIQAAYRTACELGEQCLSIAQEMQDPSRLMRAHLTLGQPLTFMGEYALARTHLEQGLARSHAQQPNSGSIRAVQDASVTCLCLLSNNLWFLGYVDQSRQRIREAHRLAQELSQPFSLAESANFTAVNHFFCREFQAVQAYAETTIALSTEHGFPHYLSHATIYRGWALAMRGHEADGIAQISQGLANWHAIGGELARAIFLALLAEAYEIGGYIEEGLAVLAEALTFADQHDERFYESELYRLKGKLLLQQTVPDASQAATCFDQALDIARRQQAKSLELRAATSLARLWQSQGKRQAAYDLLAPMYGWFTEGFDTADLKDARVLLDELG